MMQSWNPAADYPGLLLERLIAVADVVRVTRDEAANDHRPEKGETNWTLGVSGFERTNMAITAATLEYPWLQVLSGEGGGPVQFVFAVGGHAIRVCRGEADDIPDRYQQPCLPEIEQQMLGLFENSPSGRCLRLVVENAPDGYPRNIYLHEIDESSGSIVRTFLVPTAIRSASVREFAPRVEPAVVIPPVSAEALETPEERQRRKEHEDSRTRTGSDGE